MFIPFQAIAEVAYQCELAKLRRIEDHRLRCLPIDQRDFELRLREVKALEQIAAHPPVVNVRTSIF